MNTLKELIKEEGMPSIGRIMEIVAFLISVAALVIAIVAYNK